MKPRMNTDRRRSGKSDLVVPLGASLFDRVAAVLEQARSNVVRSVNSNMVWAYWLIGREIVQELEGGEERAAYGKQVIGELSTRLAEEFGRGYSAPTLWNFRQFYVVFAKRGEILSPSGRELEAVVERESVFV